MTTARALIALGLLGILAAGPAAAAAPEGGAGKGNKPAGKMGKSWDAFAARFDGNKDGKVSKDEILGKQPAFDRVDADKDGVLTAAELESAKKAAGKAGGKGQPKGKKGFLERFDADKDGRVTLAEFNSRRAKGYEEMDTNKDGLVDKAEFEARVKAAGAARELAEDAD
jgi:Ca2+-binding EF-hand superfamily protein